MRGVSGGPGLVRRLGTGDAVVIGLGSMIGAGVFAAFAPAARAAGAGLLIGLALAAAVAYCNATASAQLAAEYPASGGTYVYGRERLGPWWGFFAGWGFVVASAVATGAGVTLGRFGRVNSWDVVTSPNDVLAESMRLSASHRTVAIAMFFSVLLLVIYTATTSALSRSGDTRMG